MIVTFVGGPWHGAHQSIEDPQPTMEAANQDGSPMEYLHRESLLNLKDVVVQLFYAPMQLTAEEFSRLSTNLRVPLAVV